MKNKFSVLFITIVLICIASLVIWRSNNTIGTISGEKVVLDNGMTYILVYDYHTYKDRGWLLGKVKGSYGTSYFVFSVRNDPYQDYIYVASMGQGDFYKRIDQLE